MSDDIRAAAAAVYRLEAIVAREPKLEGVNSAA